MQSLGNKPLYLPDSKRISGLTVYCTRCKTNVIEICKETGKTLQRCPYGGDSHYFKVYVHVAGTNNERKTKKLQTRNPNEAIIEATQFKNDVKRGMLLNTQLIIEPEKMKSVSNKPVLLVNALARFVAWLRNENVPEHMRIQRSEGHVKDVERAIKFLVQSLKDEGYNLLTFQVTEINDLVVGDIFSHLENRKFSGSTFNRYLTYYTAFLKFYIEEYDIPMKNFFTRVKRKVLNPKPEAITQTEYEALLKQITPENGIRTYKGVNPTRSEYRPWLKNAIRLALETGRRREEIVNLNYKDIEESEGVLFLKVEDYKVNRIKHITDEAQKKYIYIPITDSLMELLIEMGYNEFNGQDRYILAPNEKIARNQSMSDTITRGFTHYYAQLNTGKKLTFKSLRKTYITKLQIYMSGGNIKQITGHSDDAIIERNYIDKKEIAKAGKNFNVFPKAELKKSIEQMN